MPSDHTVLLLPPAACCQTITILRIASCHMLSDQCCTACRPPATCRRTITVLLLPPATCCQTITVLRIDHHHMLSDYYFTSCGFLPHAVILLLCCILAPTTCCLLDHYCIAYCFRPHAVCQTITVLLLTILPHIHRQTSLECEVIGQVNSLVFDCTSHI
jgi:hypothetical protein